MKTIAILMMCATACAVSPTTATNERGLICDPNCDPGNFQYLVSQVVGEASGLGTQVPNSLICRHLEASCWPDPDLGEVCTPADDECSAIYQDPWGQQYLVDCSGLYGCDHAACGWGDQPVCRP